MQDDVNGDACQIAITAALSVLSERCGESDEDELDTLERQAMLLIEKVEKSSRAGLEKQLQYHKENSDAEAILKLIDYIKSWTE